MLCWMSKQSDQQPSMSPISTYDDHSLRLCTIWNWPPDYSSSSGQYLLIIPLSPPPWCYNDYLRGCTKRCFHFSPRGYKIAHGCQVWRAKGLKGPFDFGRHSCCSIQIGSLLISHIIFSLMVITWLSTLFSPKMCSIDILQCTCLCTLSVIIVRFS